MLNPDEQFRMHTRASVLSYSNLTTYFNDFFNARKAQDDQFCFEIWAAELGFKSRSYLRMVCQGKRNITSQFIKTFTLKYKFTPKEQEHFTVLALSQNSDTELLKKIYSDKICEGLEKKQPETEVQSYTQFLSSQQLPLIQLILAFDDFEGSEQNLQTLLNIGLDELHEKLGALEKLGFIHCAERSNGRVIWRSRIKSFKVPDRFSDDAFAKFHRDALTEASEKINLQDPLQRFRSIYFVTSEQKIESLCHDIEKFLNKVKQKYGSETLEDKRICKLNLQMFPISKKSPAVQRLK